MATTLITGCWIVATGGGQAARCDLWEVGDSYVANCVLNDRGETHWVHHVPAESEHAVFVSSHFFERRGVIVASKSNSILNPSAKAYIEKWN